MSRHLDIDIHLFSLHKYVLRRRKLQSCMHAPCSTLAFPVAILPAKPTGGRLNDAHRHRLVLAAATGPRNQLKKAEQQLIFTLAVIYRHCICRPSTALPTHRPWNMPHRAVTKRLTPHTL